MYTDEINRFGKSLTVSKSKIRFELRRTDVFGESRQESDSIIKCARIIRMDVVG